MTEVLDWNKSEPIVCAHCGKEGYVVLFYECCDQQRANWEALMERQASQPPVQHILWHPSWGRLPLAVTLAQDLPHTAEKLIKELEEEE